MKPGTMTEVLPSPVPTSWVTVTEQGWWVTAIEKELPGLVST
jgi:hypothetical protein